MNTMHANIHRGNCILEIRKSLFGGTGGYTVAINYHPEDSSIVLEVGITPRGVQRFRNWFERVDLTVISPFNKNYGTMPRLKKAAKFSTYYPLNQKPHCAK